MYMCQVVGWLGLEGIIIRRPLTPLSPHRGVGSSQRGAPPFSFVGDGNMKYKLETNTPLALWGGGIFFAFFAVIYIIRAPAGV